LSQSIDLETETELLAAAGSDLTPAELRGLVSGLLAGGVDQPLRRMDQALMADLQCDQEVAALCRQLFGFLLEQAEESFASPEFAYSLGLPEVRETATRAAGLRDWSLGFLFGYGLAGRRPAGEALDSLGDLAEISRLDLDSIADDAESEEAVMLIEEHLRTAAMLLHLDSRTQAGERSNGPH